METNRKCEECGAALPANAPQGLCPRCLAGMGLWLALGGPAVSPVPSGNRDPQRPPGKLRSFGDYELLEEIARGGMGVVYRARQVKLNRIVAVKMLLFGKFSSDEFVRRFQSEAQAAASLHHPNIVAIHEIGEHEGQHYFSMNFIEGKSLSELVRDQPLAAKRAAGYLQTIAEAVHYAHQHGVLHRDLKPSNVLIDEFDQPRITDFGLAKQLKGDSDITVTGQVLGSPNYMPPEQADAKRGPVGVYSDIYSLGAVLYQLLTGRPPFLAETLEDTLRQLLNNEPVAPRLLNANVSRDLETICLKCLEKEPRRRYASAQALADDLGHWLRHEPIRARPISQWERALNWTKRKPAIAALAATVLLLLTALAIGSTVAAVRIERARRQTTEQLYESYLAQARADRLSGRPGRRFDSLEAIKKAAAIRISPELRDAAIAALALLDLRVAKQWELPQPTDPDGIHFDPHLERYAVESADGNVRVRQVMDDRELSSIPCRDLGLHWLMDFSPDGRYLAMRTRETHDCVWDITRSEWAFEHLSGFLGFNPKGGSIAYVSTNGTIALWDLDSRKETQRFEVGNAAGPGSFDPEGLRLACFNAQTSSVDVWDLGSEKATVRAPIPAPCAVLTWSHDGRLLAAGCQDNSAYVLDGQSGARIAVLNGHQLRVTRLAFNHAGDLLATTGWDGSIRLWDPIRGLPLLVLQNVSGGQMQFSEDDRRLAYFAHQSGTKFGLLEVATSPVYRRLPISDPHGDVHGLDLSPDGSVIVAGGRERICFLDFASGREIGFVAHARCASVLFHPDGKSLLTSGHLGLLRWPIERARRGQTEEIQIGTPVPLHPEVASVPMWFVGQSADGGTVAAVAGSHMRAVVLNVLNPTNLIPLAHTSANYVAVSPDGQWVATGDWKSADVNIWEAATGHLQQNLPLPDSEQVLFSPDGKWLITAGTEVDYQLWEVGSWRRRFSIAASAYVPKFGEMAFSPDSRLLAIGRTSDDIRLMETTTGHPIARIEAPDRFLLSRLCFSKDGCHLLALDTVNNVHVWDLKSLRQILKTMNLDWNLPTDE